MLITSTAAQTGSEPYFPMLCFTHGTPSLSALSL